MTEKEAHIIALVQREGRISIPHAVRGELSLEIGDFVSLSIRKATDKEVLAAVKNDKKRTKKQA